MDKQAENNANKAFDHTEIPVCGYGEEAFCNCENQEQITPYAPDTEEMPDTAADCDVEIPNCVEQKCRQLKNACAAAMDRLTRDWKTANKNPFLKQSTVCRVDVYRRPMDTEPMDSFCTEQSHSCTLRALLMMGAAAAAIITLVHCCSKKG